MDPTTLAIIEAAEIASKIIGAIETIKSLFSKKPKPTDPVSALKPYLVAIINHLQFIEQQNKEIIQKLDSLPEIFRGILRDELHNQRLTDHYNNLESLYLTLSAIGDHEKWDLSSAGWISISESLTYIYRYEYRISKISEILLWTSFADFASGGKANAVFLALIENKIDYLASSRSEVQAKYEVSVKQLRSLVSAEYVSQSNIDQISRIEDLQFSLCSDKTKTIQVQREVVETISDPECCRSRTVRKIIIENQTVPDDGFNAARDAMRLSIQSNIAETLSYGQSLSEICSAQILMKWSFSLFNGQSFANADFVTREPSDEESNEFLNGATPPFLLGLSQCYGH